MIRTIFAALAIAISLADCGPSKNSDQTKRTDGRRNDGSISDVELKEADKLAFDKGDKMGKSDVLGFNHGVRVVADYPCSDLCPEETVRVIHYGIPPGMNCEKAGGLTQSRWVPMPAAIGQQDFCIPKALAAATASDR